MLEELFEESCFDWLVQCLYLGVVWRWKLSGPAAARVLRALVFVAGLFSLAGGGGPGLLAGGPCHLQHHHATAGGRGQQPCEAKTKKKQTKAETFHTHPHLIFISLIIYAQVSM